jgi:TonB family protein
MTAPRLAFTLLESAHTTSWGVRAASSASVLGQIALAVGVVMGSSQMMAPRDSTIADERPSFLAPLFKPAPRPAQQTLTYAALGGASLADAPVGASETHDARPDRALKIAETVATGDQRPPAQQIDDDATRAYSEIEVDSAATRDPDSDGPVYPPKLMAKGIEGSVLATFVVDESGRPDITTFIPLEATNPEFADAVRLALPRMKFRPAKRGASTVRQQVEQRFTFRVVRP